MKSTRYIALLIIQFFFFALCFAQRNRIDSLLKVLPTLQDRAKIDCLNELSEAYTPNKDNGYNPFGVLIINRDSTWIYAQRALVESEKMNYLKGMSKAYINLGRAEGLSWGDYTATDYYFTRALELTLQINDDNQLARVNGYMGWVKWIEGRFSEAMVYFEKAASSFEKTKDTICLSETYSLMAHTAQESGRYAEALQFATRYRELRNEELYKLLSKLYESIGDFETALYYAQNDPNKSADNVANMEIGNIFRLMKQYDSSLYYFQLAEKDSIEGKLYSRWAELYTALKQYDTALVYGEKALKIHKKVNDGNEIMRVLLALSRAYLGKGDIKTAIKYARELLEFANRSDGKQYIRDGHLVSFEIYDQLQIKDRAYYHLKQYTAIKDSIDLEISAQKLAFYKTKSEREQAQLKINTLNDQKKLQQQKLEQTAQQKNFLIAGIIAGLLVAVVVFRNILLKRKNERDRRELAENELLIQQLESEKTKAELQQQAVELEMQALRSQMNPHFIFNSLNSINMFILENNKLQASEYLSKFSRLVRLILQNSQEAFIALDKELEALRLYLELEALRFEQKFEYKISVNDEVDTTMIKVPPLIIQPYAENAIWHGLMHLPPDESGRQAGKKEKGHLEIELYLKEKILFCKITDDGVGRKRAEELKSKSSLTYKSMGMRITADRIAILQQQEQNNTFVSVKDLVFPDNSPAGTEVLIKIPLQYD